MIALRGNAHARTHGNGGDFHSKFKFDRIHDTHTRAQLTCSIASNATAIEYIMDCMQWILNNIAAMYRYHWKASLNQTNRTTMRLLIGFFSFFLSARQAFCSIHRVAGHNLYAYQIQWNLTRWTRCSQLFFFRFNCAFKVIDLEMQWPNKYIRKSDHLTIRKAKINNIALFLLLLQKTSLNWSTICWRDRERYLWSRFGWLSFDFVHLRVTNS